MHRLATDLALAGFVSNTANGVLIEVEGLPVHERPEPHPLHGAAHDDAAPHRTVADGRRHATGPAAWA